MIAITKFRQVPSEPFLWVSEDGRVRHGRKELKTRFRDARGGSQKPYKVVFAELGKRRMFYVHKLVCETYVGPPSESQ